MNIKLNTITNKIIFLVIILATFVVGKQYGEYSAQLQPRTAKYDYTVENLEEGNVRNLDFSLFWETWNALESKYVDKEKIDPLALYYGAIKGMVAAVDDQYTFFLTPEENKQSKADLEGTFSGIGAELGLDNNFIVIVTPLKDSPAEKAGVRAGDIIVKVNDESTEDWTLTKAVDKIRGPEGEVVTLTMVRKGADKEIEIPIKRGEIKVPFVELSVENGVAIVELSRFGEPTNDLWDQVVNQIIQKQKSGEVNSMILDMRGNPGGFLDSAVHISSEFLKKGQVVVTQEYADKDPYEYVSQRDGKLQNMPLVVLINEGSASASEIVAGALRDYGKATLVGQNSFGKGTVQEALELQQGAGVHITVSKWILPKGDWIQKEGIKPSIEVENVVEEGNTLTRATDKQLDKAIETLKQ